MTVLSFCNTLNGYHVLQTWVVRGQLLSIGALCLVGQNSGAGLAKGLYISVPVHYRVMTTLYAFIMYTGADFVIWMPAVEAILSPHPSSDLIYGICSKDM